MRLNAGKSARSQGNVPECRKKCMATWAMRLTTGKDGRGGEAHGSIGP